MGSLHFDITADNRNFIDKVRETESQIQTFTKNVEAEGNDLDASFDRMASGLKKVAAAATAAFTISKGWDFAKQCIEVRSQIQSLEISFETLLNSKEKADQLISDIRQFAATTPMDMSTLAQGAQTMLGFNLEAEKVMPLLKSIGDISMGNAQKFSSLTLAFSQMSATGKLMGQDLLQMINAGFNPLAQISEKTGKSLATLKQEMENGKISVEMVTSAFMDATAEGGKFYGMLAKQSEGLSGSFAYLRGTFIDAMNDIGSGLEGMTVTGINATANLVKNYKAIGEAVMILVAAYGSYKAAIMVNAAIEMGTIGRAAALTLAKNRLTAAVLRLNKAISLNPWGIAAAAATALAYGIYKLATRTTEAEKAQQKLNDAAADCEKATRAETIQVDMLFARLKAAKKGTEEYQAAKDAIMGKYGAYLKSLGDEKTALNDIAKAYQLVTDEITKAAKARAMEAFTKTASDDYVESEGNAKKRIYDLLNKKFGDQKDSDGISLTETYYAKIVPVIEGKEEITDEIQEIINKFNRVEYKQLGTVGHREEKNDIQTELDAVVRSRTALNDVLDSARIKFGEAPAKTGETVFDVANASINQLTEELPKAIKAYKELKETDKPDQAAIQAKEDEINSIRKRVKEREKELTVIEDVKSQIDILEKQQLKYSKDDKEYKDLATRINSLKRKLPDSTNKTPEQLAADQKKAHQAYLDLIDKQAKELANAEEEYALKAKQAEIDGMAEGTDKVLAQMELDFEKERFQLEKDKQEAVAAEIARQKVIFDAREDEKAAKNPKYAKATFDPLTDVDTTDVDAILSQYDELAKLLTDKQNQIRSERQEAETSAMNEYLKEFGTYLEKRQAMIALANERMAKATTEGEKKTIAGQLTRDLSALDIEATKTTNAISRLFGDMSKKTVSDLRAIADAGQQALEFLTSGQWDETKGLQFGITKEMFETLRKSPAELDKIRKAIYDINAEADNSETALNKIKIGLDKIFKNKPDTKEFKKGLNDILEGVQAVTQAISFMSDALSNVGAEGLGSAFNDVAGVLNSAMSGFTTGASIGGLWGGVAGAAIGGVSKLVGVFNQLHDKKHEKRIQAMQKQVEALEKSYERLGDSVDDAFSKDASNLLNQQNEMLERKKVLIQNQIKEEEAKKNTDDDRIKEWKNQLESIDKLIGENKEKAVDAIFGEDLKSAIENYADTYANAWAGGEDRAKSAKDTVKKMMQQMVTESIKAAIQSSKSMEQIRKKLQEFYADNVLSGWEQDYVLNMAEELQRELDEQFGWANKLMSGNNAGAKSAATAGLYETLSEDTGQEISGRLTAAIDMLKNVSDVTSEGNTILNNILYQNVQTNEHLSDILVAWSTLLKLLGVNFNDIKKAIKEQA